MTDAPAEISDAPAEAPLRSQWRDVWRRFRSHHGAMLALVILTAILLFVSIGPLLWRIDPIFVDYRARNQGFSLAHPFGTDQLGRDLLARMMAGGQVSIAVGLVAMGIALSLWAVWSAWCRAISGGWTRR